MNDQSQMMNQHQILSQMNQPQVPPVPAMGQPPMVGQMSQQQMMSHMNPGQMMGQSYGTWTQPPSNIPLPSMNMMNLLPFPNQMIRMYGTSKQGRNNWKGKKPMDKRKDGRRKHVGIANSVGIAISGTGGGVGGGGGRISGGVGGVGGMGYKPPTLQELEQQNRMKARRFYPKKRYNRMGPYAHAPRNTSSFIIRAKKAGGIASLVSPYPVTPAVLPTPVFSPSREALVEMAKEEWGVDGYGSMKGLIRLRSSPGHETEVDDYEDEDEGGSSDSDVEEHLEVERRLDHDLSRFEMIYPDPGADHNGMLENQVDDQDMHIAQLEEENILLKDRLYLMEREVGDLRRRLQFLERRNQVVEVINEEVVENVSEYDSEDLHPAHLHLQKSDEEVDSVHREEEAGGVDGAKDGKSLVDSLGNLVCRSGEEGEASLNATEGKHDAAVRGDSSMLIKVDNKDRMLENEQIEQNPMEGSVLENSRVEFADRKGFVLGSTSTEVKEVVKSREAVKDNSALDTDMEDIEKVTGSVDNANGNSCPVNVVVGAESRREALENEPTGTDELDKTTDMQ
ncbi:hypothetical protein AKJ16_DCAP09297 [Drosera capensis]